jgi:hypothetical protein
MQYQTRRQDTMKTFENQGRQGDVLFTKVEKLPAGVKRTQADVPVIVAHSETGHHHSFAKHCGVQYFETNNPFIAYLRVESVSYLEHRRADNTHDTFRFKPGIYELRRPGEYVDEEETRMVQD